MTVETPFRAEEASLASLLGKLDKRLAALGAGGRAAVRRLDPESPSSPEFWRMVVDVLGEEPAENEARMSAWAIVLRGLARSRLDDDERSTSPAARGVGGALARAQFSEARLVRLLRAEGAPLRLEIMRAADFLVAKGERFGWLDFAQLLLIQDPGSREKARNRIARDYFYQESKSKNGDSR